MTTPSPRRRRALPRWAPLVLSVVFVLVAALAIGGPVLWGGSSDDSPVAGPPTSSEEAAPPGNPACAPQPGDATSTTDGVLKIGTIYPRTGRDLDSTGQQLAAATEMAVSDVAAAGGVPGLQPPSLGPETELDEGEPGSATTCESAGTLLAEHVDAIVGPSASTDSLQAIPRVTGAGVLMMSPASTVAELSTAPDHGLFFRTAVPDDVQGKALADTIADEQGRNVAVVARNDPYATGLARAVTDELRTRSVASTTLAYDGSGDPPTFAGLADTIARGPYDGIVFVGYGEIADLVHDLLDRNVTPQNHRMYGTEGFLLNTFAGQASPGSPERLAGFRGFVPYADGAFNERLKAFRPGMQDLTYGAQAYDAVISIALAAAAARSDDPARLAEQLPLVTRGGQKCTSYQTCVTILQQNPRADIDYDGVSGPLGFTGQGDPCQGVYLLSAFDTTSHLQGFRSGASPDRC